MTGLTFATCDMALPPAGGAPDWVQLFPDGKMTGRDGRTFDLADAGRVIEAFKAGGVDLPVDFEHQNDIPEAKLNGPVPLAGWIKELRADDTGLWGRVEWTATASQLIGRKEYRHISPSFWFDGKTRQITRLRGAGLVHSPNLHLHALASQDPTMQPQTTTPDTARDPAAASLMQRLVKMMGLPSDTTEAQFIASLEAALKDRAKPDPKEYMPLAAVQSMMQERGVERLAVAEGRAQQKVDVALRKGYITPAMKDWALALCRSDVDAFDTFLAATGPVYGHLFQLSGLTGAPPPARHVHDSDMAAAVCAQLGLPPGSLKD